MQHLSFARRWVTCVGVAILTGVSGGLAAATYPDRTVTIVAPYPAGGYADVLSRVIGKNLSEQWHQSVIVEDRTGATGMIGTDHVAKSTPDGYTLLMGSTAELALNAALYSKMQYDTERDLAGVILLSVSPLVLVVNTSVPVSNMKEFIALARKKPGEIGYASPGDGSPQHIAGEWLQLITGTKLNHIPFRGGAPQLTSIVGEQVQCGFVSLPNAAAYIQSGKLRAIAVLGKKRAPLLPTLPTMDEQGIHGIDVSQWRGVVVPKGTPAGVVEALNSGFQKALGSDAVQESLRSVGEETLGGTSVEFDQFIRNENLKYRMVVKELGIHLHE